jgi:peptide/nickel transport system substrate-binding protein
MRANLPTAQRRLASGGTPMLDNSSRRSFLALASAAATTAMFGTALRSARADTGGMIEEIKWALPAIPDTLFVPHAWQTYTGAIMSLVQEGLLAFGNDLALVPAVSDTWQQVDLTTYKYHIRQGATFGDGSAVTPDDVIATMKLHMTPDMGSQLAPFYSPVASVDATGASEVTVKLKSASVQFQYTAAHMAGFLFKKSQLEAHAKDIGTPQVLPLGTGPYKLVEFAPADHVIMEINPNYWGPKPPAKRISFQAIADRQTRLLAMQNGDIDGTFDIAISDIDQWKQLPNVKVITAPSLGFYCLTLDISKAPFDDVHVRRAIAYSIDRAGLVQALLKGNGEPAWVIDSPAMWAGVMPPDEVKTFYGTLNNYGFDLEKAKAELKQSAHPDGFEVSVPTSKDDPYMVNMMQSVAENLKQIGITMKVQELDSNQWLAGYFRHENLGAQIMAYYPDFPDPANYPYLFYFSANAVKDNMNGSNYKNPEVDKLLMVATEQSDPKTRADALKQVFKITNDDVALVPIFWPATAMALSTKYNFTGFNAFWSNTPWVLRGFTKA